MKILVHEFETGGGRGDALGPASLVREGAAMRAALLADLAAAPGIDEIRVTVDPRLSTPLPPCVRPVPPVRGAGSRFRRAMAEADLVWIVAPESDGILARLVDAVRREGRLLAGPDAATIRRVSHKARLARRLHRLGLPVPASRVLPARADRRVSAATAERVGYPLVVKPARGAGCRGIGLVRRPGDLDAAVTAARRVAGRGPVLLQAYIDGVAASVSLVADGRRAVPLAVHAQRIGPGAAFAYDGGATPLRHPRADRAAERARAACEACPGLRGYVGVDVVVTGSDAFVIEVNPRLTTSYLGLRVAVDDNVAALALAACRGRLPGASRLAREAVFDADGTVRAVEAFR